MIIKKCEIDDIEKISEFYDNVIIYLDNHINYPKWKYKIYPSIISVTDNINKGFQYEAIINNEIVASFVLNDDPEGSYEKCKWSKDINKFMVIHGFAIKPELQNKGIGTNILEFCKEEACVLKEVIKVLEFSLNFINIESNNFLQSKYLYMFFI